MWSDPGRKLKTDPLGREMLISWRGGAVRAAAGHPFARVPAGDRPVSRPGAATAAGPGQARCGHAGGERERRLLEAVPHRHTHRGPFTDGPLPAGLVVGLQHDALAEGAALALVDGRLAYQRLADLVAAAARRGNPDPLARADIHRWTRDPASTAKDGIPASAFSARPGHRAGTLPQRDFDLGRGLGRL